MSINRLSGLRVTLGLAVLALASSFSHAQALTLVQSGTRYAGSGAPGFNGDSGPAATVNLTEPSYIVFDSTGNQYISDTQNNCVRRVDPSGNITTIAGLAVSSQGDTCDSLTNPTPNAAQGLYHPTGLAIDSTNRLYIADSMHHCVRALPSGATGVASLVTIAGTCGTSSTASVTPSPNGLAIDVSNNLYVSLQDTTNTIYQVIKHAPGASSVDVCYLAGNPSPNVSLACPGMTNGVILSNPSGLAIDANNNLFIADTGNNCVREVANLAIQKTAVGRCLNDNSGTSTTALHNPYGLTLSPTQSLFIAQSSPDNVVSYAPATNTLTLIAGLPNGTSGPYDFTQDGASAASTPLNTPRGIAFNSFDNFGNLYIADSGNNIVRKLSNNIIFSTTHVSSPSAVLHLIFSINQSVILAVTAGPDISITNNTCTGSLTPAPPGSPATTCQVFVHFIPTRPGLRSSFIRLTDSISNTTITQGLQTTATGPLSVFTPGTVATIANGLSTPTAITVDTAGNLYVVVHGATSGTASIQAIPAGGGPALTLIPQGSGLISPSAIATDAAGNWFVADATQGTIARFSDDGAVNLNYITGLDTPTALAIDAFGNLYIAQSGNTHNVIEAYAAGPSRIIAGNGSDIAADKVPANTASFVSPSALAIDRNGILYIADRGGHLVYAVDHANYIHAIAGNGTASITLPGHATGTALLSPSSLAVDPTGNIYIADSVANRVYIVYASVTGTSDNIAPILGTGIPGNTGDGSNASLAQISAPISLALDGSGDLFIVDSGNSSIREIVYPSPTLNLDTTTVGNTSHAQLTTLANLGTDALVLTTPISISDPHFTLDSSTTTCGTTLAPSSSCIFGFTFTPTASGPLTATATLVSNSYNTPQPIQLKATGKLLDVLHYTAAPVVEVYGQPFSEILTLNITGPAPTGTVTFTNGTQTLCTYTGTLTSTTTCNVPASSLPVGNYPITFTYSGDINYSSASGATTLSITPARLTVTVDNVIRTYGTSNPDFTSTITGALNGDIFTNTYFTAATVTAPTGNYLINDVVSGPAASNYAIVVLPGVLCVAHGAITITANSSTRAYGTPNPTLSGTIIGLVNGDRPTVTYTTTATQTSIPGRYIIGATISGPSAANYVATIRPGALDISAAPTTTSLFTPEPTAASGTTLTFIATVTSAAATPSGTVSFFDGSTILGSSTLNAGGVASFTTSTLAAGTHTILAAFQANTNFLASSAPLSQAIAAPAGSFTLTSAPSATQFIKKAGSTTYQLKLSSVGTFAGQVALACSGLPIGASCSFSSNPTLTPGGTANVTMTVTTASTAMPTIARFTTPTAFHSADLAPLTTAAVLPVELTGLGVLFTTIRRKTLSTRKPRLLLILAFTASIIGLTGCGQSNAAFKTYTINVTATSVNFAAPTQTATFILSIGNQ